MGTKQSLLCNHLRFSFMSLKGTLYNEFLSYNVALKEIMPSKSDSYFGVYISVSG